MIASIHSTEEFWKTFYNSSLPHTETLPESISGIFDEFEILCLIKVLRPDKLVPAAKELIVKHMGKEFVSPPPFDLEYSFNDSKNNTPLIFVLPGADPLESLNLFARTKKKQEALVTISLG